MEMASIANVKHIVIIITIYNPDHHVFDED